MIACTASTRPSVKTKPPYAIPMATESGALAPVTPQLPTRTAARKASEHFLTQLMSSSDEDDDEGGAHDRTRGRDGSKSGKEETTARRSRDGDGLFGDPSAARGRKGNVAIRYTSKSKSKMKPKAKETRAVKTKSNPKARSAAVKERAEGEGLPLSSPFLRPTRVPTPPAVPVPFSSELPFDAASDGDENGGGLDDLSPLSSLQSSPANSPRSQRQPHLPHQERPPMPTTAPGGPLQRAGAVRSTDKSAHTISELPIFTVSLLPHLFTPGKSAKTPPRSPKVSPSKSSKVSTPSKASKFTTPIKAPKVFTPSKAAKASSPSKPSKVKLGAANSASAKSVARQTLDNGSSTESMKQGLWDLADCASFVFVLVDTTGEAINDVSKVLEDTYWWPGKVENVSPYSTPLSIAMYHPLMPSAPVMVKLRTPSPYNIRPIHALHGVLSFDESTFTIPLLPSSSRPNPRKKNRLDPAILDTGILDKWKNAVRTMVKEYEDDGDLVVPLKSSSNEYPSESVVTVNDDVVSVSPSGQPFVPPPSDETLEIPGDLVLAREKSGSTLYWPARLEAYVPPTRPSQKPKYKVEFLDRRISVIPRDLFCTSEEPEFATCKIGQWESSYGEDSDSEESDTESDASESKRAPSPVPVLPAPPPNTFQCLSMRQQLAYIKPVLIATLNDEYAPARRRHADFVRGGRTREEVLRNVVMRGPIGADEVGCLARCLGRWALKGERRAPRMIEEGMGTTVVCAQEKVAYEDPNVIAHPSEDATESTPTPTTPPSSLFTKVSSFSTETTSHSRAGAAHETTKRTGEDTAQASSVELEYAARQRGCEAYETLSGVEKLEYVLNVLHYEAVLQLILWRAGKRTSIELLSEEEEQVLHDVAQQASLETDWVRDVMRLRDSKVRLLRKQAVEEKVKEATVIGGTRSRPKTIVNSRA